MAQWTVDPAHSEITFKVKHLLVSTVTGRFKTFSGSVSAVKPDFSDARVQFEAAVDSISTNNEQRDAHLKTPDFFDASGFPNLTFVSTSITRKAGQEYTVTGDMTIRGTKRRIALDATYNGTARGFEGDVAGFDITGELNRREFGLRWNSLTETGGVVVSDMVRLDIAVELKKVAVEVPVEA
jgi:polyisoprenoid-binding protein YceI